MRYLEVNIYEDLVKDCKYTIKVRRRKFIFDHQDPDRCLESTIDAYKFILPIPEFDDKGNMVVYFCPTDVDNPNGSLLERLLRHNGWGGRK